MTFSELLDEYIDARLDYKEQKNANEPHAHKFTPTYYDDDPSIIRVRHERVEQRYEQARLMLNRVFRR